MKDFIAMIKTYSTQELIYLFSKLSIEMAKGKEKGMLLIPETSARGIFTKESNVLLTSWDVPAIAYLSICNSNDYRCNVIENREELTILVNAYRKY